MRVLWILAIAVSLCATATGEDADEDAQIEVEQAEVNQVEGKNFGLNTPCILPSEIHTHCICFNPNVVCYSDEVP